MRYVTDVPCNVHIVLNTTTLSTPVGIKSQWKASYIFIYTFTIFCSIYFYIPMLSIKSQSSPRVTNWYLNASIYHWSKNYWFVHSYKLHCHTQIYYSTYHWLFYYSRIIDSWVKMSVKSMSVLHHFIAFLKATRYVLADWHKIPCLLVNFTILIYKTSFLRAPKREQG